MADEQQQLEGESSAQGKPTDDATGPNSEEGLVNTDSSPELNEERGTADGPQEASQAAVEGNDPGQIPLVEDDLSLPVTENQNDETEKGVNSDPSSSSNLEDQTNVNNGPSSEVQIDSQQNQDCNHDVNSDSKSQNEDTDLPGQDVDNSRSDPEGALEDSPREQDSKRDSPNLDSDSASPQEQNTVASSPQESINGMSEQEPSDRQPSRDPAVGDETLEDGRGDGAKEEQDPAEADTAVSQPEPDQVDAELPTVHVGGGIEEAVPTSEEMQQSQDSGDEPRVPEENASDLPAADDANQEVPVETEGADVPDDSPERVSSPPQSPAQEPENPEGASAEMEVSNGVSSSPQSPTQEQTAADSPSGITADVIANSNGASSSPQPPVQDQTPANGVPAPLQHNNNEFHESKQFISGSVHIPTADDGDESFSNRGFRGDLRDQAIYKMRPSLAMDAHGDSNSHHLPALIRPDPHRMARSLPATMDRPDAPGDYHSGNFSHHGGGARAHIPRIPSASGSTKAEVREGDVRRALNSAKLPPSVMKMSTVMVSARKRAVLNRNSSVFYEEKQHRKVISLDQAINSRPPMPFDLDGPGPCSYSPRNKPLTEDNAPEYTFGHRLDEKSGGGRTAYAKSWFNSNSGFTQKVHYEKRWPSPAHYNSTRPLLGHRKPTMLDYPSFSIGVKTNFSISKRGSENEPAPNEYNRSMADAAILRKAPSYTISHRHRGTQLWGGNETTPGPGAYNPRWGHSSGTVHHPSFTIQGVRRLKSHHLGPHSTF